MAAHSSVLAWRIPGMGEPGELPSMGSHEDFKKLKIIYLFFTPGVSIWENMKLRQLL